MAYQHAFQRCKTREVKVGNLIVGGDSLILLQSMANAVNHDVEANSVQFWRHSIRLFLTGVFFFLLQLGDLLAQQRPESSRSPWQGFGLGSRVRLRTLITQEGKTLSEEVKTCEIVGIHTEFAPRISTTVIKDGKRDHFTRYPTCGLDPRAIGLKFESSKESTLTIEGKAIPVAVSYWANAVRGRKSKLILYEADSSGVKIPYHEIDASGVSLSIGPRVVKAEYSETQLDKDGNPVGETHFVEAATKLGADVTIKDKKVRVVVFDVASSEWTNTHDKRLVYKGEVAYSNDVPGRQVRKELIYTMPKGTKTCTMAVDAFETQPQVPTPDFDKLKSDERRPAIPNPAWNGMRLGAWAMSVLEIRDRDAKDAREFEVGLVQVIQVRSDGTHVELRKKLTKEGWKDIENNLIKPANIDNREKAESAREVIELLGERVVCERSTLIVKDERENRSNVQWIPLTDKWKNIVTDAGLKYAKETENLVIRDSVREHRIRSNGTLTNLDAKCTVGGKAVSCVVFKRTTWEDEKPWFVEYTFHSKALPLGVVGTVSVGKRDYSFSHKLDFGEADKAIPSVDALRGLYAQAAQLLKALDLENIE